MMAAARFSLPIPASFSQWWSAKAPRERRLLAALLGIASQRCCGWALATMVRDIAAMRIAQGQSAAALADARHAVDEIAGLTQAPAPTRPTDDSASLERVLAQHGLRGGVTQISWQDGRAHVVLGAVGFDALIAALEALQREARLRVIEATLTRAWAGTIRAGSRWVAEHRRIASWRTL
jgi:type II secretory pathway component PulM